jgi:futalosine hydrolase
MNCLLLSATAMEVSPFLSHLNETQKRWHIDLEMDVLIGGIGLTASTYQLTRHLSIRKPDLVVQAGVAGGFDKHLPLASVVCVKKDRIADESVVEEKQLRTLFDLRLLDKNQPPYNQGWLQNPYTTLLERSRLQQVTGITVNHISTSNKMMALYHEHYKPSLESMEGAALHYVCLMENIPFIQLRAISNYAGERNKKKWKMADAVSNLNKELIRLFESL